MQTKRREEKKEKFIHLGVGAMVLIDKAVMFVICIVINLMENADTLGNFDAQIGSIAILLLCLTLSSFMSYYEKENYVYMLFLGYVLLCVLNPWFVIFIPLVCYDVVRCSKRYILALLLIPIIMHYDTFSLYVIILLILLLVVTALLESRYILFNQLRHNYITLQDQVKETSMQFVEKNKELLEKQDYEVHLATLTERNRIARDIHDNVGHLLSSSLIQTGALIAISKDESLNGNLDILKNTLSNAMDSIRSSVHDLHEQSIDLHTEIKALLEKFTFCKVMLNYDIEKLEQNSIKYCFIAVIKEALSNVIRHSNATKVVITLHEHPAIYQLIISDNGTNVKKKDTGIGLRGITERVNALNGIVNFKTENGFCIFISISKIKK